MCDGVQVWCLLVRLLTTVTQSSGFNNLLIARLEKCFITLETFSMVVLTGHIGMIASNRTFCTEMES